MQITTNFTARENHQVNSEQSDAAKELSLYHAVKGTVFQGDILDVRGNQVSIQVGKYILNALLENGMNVNIGDNLSFLVKENTGAKVILKPFTENGQNAENSLLKTLEESSLPVNERTVTAVKELMNHGMPVDKNSMAEIGRLLNQFKSANVETIISLKSHNLPVTEENITQYEAYQNAEGKLLDQMNSIVKELSSMVESGTDRNSLGKTSELLGKLSELFQGVGGQPAKTLEAQEGRVMVAENQRADEKSKDMAENLRQTVGEENHAGVSTGEKVRVESNPPEQIVREVKEQLMAEVKNIESGIKSKLLITPEQLAEKGEQAVKELYKDIIRTTDKMMEILQASGEGKSKLMTAAGDLKNNMNFMSDFNGMAAYAQLPLKLNGREQTGELYVLSRKRNRNQKDAFLTAFLHLDMESLGATDVRVTMAGNQVSTKFTLDNEASMQLVEEHLPELKKKLEELGYSVQLSVEELTETKIPFERILEADRPTRKVKRFSFDVRA